MAKPSRKSSSSSISSPNIASPDGSISTTLPLAKTLAVFSSQRTSSASSRRWPVLISTSPVAVTTLRSVS